MTARVCPHCGYDIEADSPILINDFAMNGPTHPLFYKGEAIRLTRGEAMVVWSLMKSYPDHLSTMAIAERVGCEETLDPSSSVRVMIWRIRRKLRQADAPDAIMTMPHYHYAYIWSPL